MILVFRDVDGSTRIVNVAAARSVEIRLPRADDEADEIREYVYVNWHTQMGGELTSIMPLQPGEGARLISEVAQGGMATWRGN